MTEDQNGNDQVLGCGCLLIVLVVVIAGFIFWGTKAGFITLGISVGIFVFLAILGNMDSKDSEALIGCLMLIGILAGLVYVVWSYGPWMWQGVTDWSKWLTGHFT